MSYINIYLLVIKLIIENNLNDIYKKFWFDYINLSHIIIISSHIIIISSHIIIISSHIYYNFITYIIELSPIIYNNHIYYRIITYYI